MAEMSTTTSSRPTLLTVICILSFIMGAWGIVSSGINLTRDQTAVVAEAQAKLEETRAQLGDQAGGLAGKVMDSTLEITRRGAEHAVPMSVAAILLSLLSLFGAWRMWNLQKSGFWMYVLASVLGLVVPIYFLGGSMVALASVGVAGFFSLLFIILYALNLKHMH